MELVNVIRSPGHHPWQLALGQQYYVASLRVWAYLILTEVEHREFSLHLALHYLADRLGALVLEIMAGQVHRSRLERRSPHRRAVGAVARPS